MKPTQFLMQLYIYGLKEENRILRRKLAETIVERDRLQEKLGETESELESLKEWSQSPAIRHRAFMREIEDGLRSPKRWGRK